MKKSASVGAVDLAGGFAHDAALNVESGKLKVALITDSRGVVMLLAGELDLETAPELEQRLAAIDETRLTRLVIDLRGVTFMDSTGLRAVVRAHQFAQSNGHTLVLRRGPGQVQRLFELTGVGGRLTFEDD